MDVGLLIALQSLRVDVLTQLMALLCALGDGGLVWVVLALVMLVFAEKRPAAIALLLSVLACWLLVSCLLVDVFDRTRPCDASIGVTAVMGVSRAGSSFPSFHAACGGAAVAIVWLMRSPASSVPVMLLALAIMFARMFCGVDYPSDILAGAVLGIVIGVVLSLPLNGLAARPRAASRHSGRRTSVGGGKHSRY